MGSRILVQSIKEQTELIFFNMQISMNTCNRDYSICGAPAWRYIYHTLHSCDKWFVNPNLFDEPKIHADGLDKVDIPCEKVLSDEELSHYFEDVKKKTLSYLDAMEDNQLSEKPKGCDFTRLELILGQFRHFMCHIGILNGITISKKNQYPVVIGLDKWKEKRYGDSLFEN